MTENEWVPVGNLNPLYTGALFGEDNVKNTDAFDPASASKPTSAKLTTGSTTPSGRPDLVRRLSQDPTTSSPTIRTRSTSSLRMRASP